MTLLMPMLFSIFSIQLVSARYVNVVPAKKLQEDWKEMGVVEKRLVGQEHGKSTI